MHIHTHGSKGDPVIIILHPMGITGEKMYEIVGSKFRGEYYFITPDMGGHGSEKRKFRSARAEAAALCCMEPPWDVRCRSISFDMKIWISNMSIWMGRRSPD